MRAEDPREPNKVYKRLLAHPAQDMWALGCILYLLCTGSTLFQATIQDNLSNPSDLKALLEWSNTTKKKKIEAVKDDYARSLLALLLHKNSRSRISASGVLQHPFLTGRDVVRLQGEPPLWDVFLSYRVNSDLHHAEALYHALCAEGLEVWWDKKSLLPGQNWEEGFCQGLIGAGSYLCLLSRGAINDVANDRQNFGALKHTSPCDNFLLEMRLALELRDRTMFSDIFPVLIGDKNKDSGLYSNYFHSDCHPSLSDVVVDEVERKVWDRLEMDGLGPSSSECATVSNVMANLLSHRQLYWEGDLTSAIDNTVRCIVERIESCEGNAVGASPWNPHPPLQILFVLTFSLDLFSPLVE